MIYFGRWQWRDEAGGFSWNPPVGAVANIDLRLQSEREVKVTPTGWALFDIPGPDQTAPGLTAVADAMADTLPLGKRAALSAALNLAMQSGEALGDYIWRYLTVDRDPTGVTQCSGLLPSKGKLRLYFGSYRREENFTPGAGVYWPAVKAALRHQYRHRRAESFAGQLPANHYLKILDKWREDYKLDWREFVPDDLPQELPVKHATVVTETFPGTSDTLGGDQTWTEVSGTWDNISGDGRHVPETAGTYGARCESVVSGADMYCSMTIKTDNGVSSVSGSGPATNFAAAADTYYSILLYAGNDNLYIRRVDAGSNTNLANVAVTRTLNVPYKLESTGGFLEAFQDGVSRLTYTDGSPLTGVRGGIHAVQSETFDNWEAGDLGVAAFKARHYYDHIGHPS